MSSELRDKLAAIEHERWADWQLYLFSKCARLPGAGAALVIPEDMVERWQRQIDTAYADLTDAERQSDLDQVDRYWPLVDALLKRAEGAESERDRLVEENRQLREAGNELVRWLSLGTSTRTSTTDLMLDIARWREVAGDDAG